MFRSLYTRFQDTSYTKPDNTATWTMPATYMGGVVSVNSKDWQLEVTGLVDHPCTFSLKELRNLPQVTQNRRLVSIDGWTFRTEWMGIPFHHLVEKVKPHSNATIVRQINLSGHVDYLPLTDIIKNRALLCYSASGKMLPPLYGGPLRLLIFDRYSYKGLSQLCHIEFITADTDHRGYWEEKGYSASGEIEPGRYYAFDLKKIRPVPQPGEITIY